MKKIAILTSGGDAPGMNNVVASLIKEAIINNIIPYVVYDGYEGLYSGNIKLVDEKFAKEIINRGGTLIGTARFLEFIKPKIRLQAINNLKSLGINDLFVIGGDGSYQGALKLSQEGLNCICLPGTIDNDVSSSEETIGFDSALNIVTQTIDRLNDTNMSHKRCGILEVMGRYCGDIAFVSGIGSSVDVISTSQQKLTKTEIINKIKECYEKRYRSVLVLVSEHLYDVNQLAKEIESETGYVTRANILGHLQRGGVPTARDRYLASWMAKFALHQLIKGKSNIAVGIFNNNLESIKLDVALKMQRTVFKI